MKQAYILFIIIFLLYTIEIN